MRSLPWWVLPIIAMGLLPPSSFATPPAPGYGTAVVDGNTAEWDLTNDFFAEMHRSGDSTMPLSCNAYLRYDCATSTMYVLVLGESNVTLYYNSSGILVGSWVAINTTANKVVTSRSGNNGAPPDIAWVGLGYDGVANHVLGLEASFTIQPGSYLIYMFQGVWEVAAASFAATIGYPATAPALVIDCPVNAVCCHPDGSCTIVPEAECFDIRLGYGSSCTPSPCPQPQGACCFPDGACVYVLQTECDVSGGDWLGYGSDCDPNPCVQPSGACCFPDGSCRLLTAADCAQAAGTVWLGYGSNCTPNLCAQPPAGCCFPDGVCQVVTAAQCAQAGAQWLGIGTDCTPNVCVQPQGACCLPDGSCQLLTEVGCTALDGAWSGLNTSCDPNLCPQPQPATGACCFTDGICRAVTAAACAAGPGQYQGDSVLCTPATCQTSVPTERTSWGRIKANYR